MSGNNNNGTLINGPTWITGKVGSALSFNSYSSYINFPNISLINMPYTVIAWIYKNDLNDFDIVGGGSGGTNKCAHYIVRSSKLYFGIMLAILMEILL